MIEKQKMKRSKDVKVTFSIPMEWLPRKVSLVGDFNDWDLDANRMRKKGGTWTTSVSLAPGATLPVPVPRRGGSLARRPRRRRRRQRPRQRGLHRRPHRTPRGLTDRRAGRSNHLARPERFLSVTAPADRLPRSGRSRRRRRRGRR